MPETFAATSLRKAHQMPPPVVVASGHPLLARQTTVGLLNLRGNPADTAFLAAVEQTLGVQPPVTACTTVAQGELRLVWSGPDEWLLVAPHGQETALAARLCAALADNPGGDEVAKWFLELV